MLSVKRCWAALATGAVALVLAAGMNMASRAEAVTSVHATVVEGEVRISQRIERSELGVSYITRFDGVGDAPKECGRLYLEKRIRTGRWDRARALGRNISSSRSCAPVEPFPRRIEVFIYPTQRLVDGMRDGSIRVVGELRRGSRLVLRGR
jgi:hypothetical protein